MSPEEVRDKMPAKILAELAMMKHKCNELSDAGYMSRLTVRGNTVNGNIWWPYNFRMIVEDSTLENGNVKTLLGVSCRGGGASFDTYGNITQQDIATVMAKAWDEDQKQQDRKRKGAE